MLTWNPARYKVRGLCAMGEFGTEILCTFDRW